MAQSNITIEQLRERYATSALSRDGWSFEAVIAIPFMRKVLECGVVAAQRASHINRTRPHWMAECES
jgi:hypothetical protein